MFQLEESSSGLISKEELLQVVTKSFNKENILVSAEATEGFVATVFSKADQESSGAITRKALSEALQDQDDEAIDLFKSHS